jgi:hypothetical protein
MRTITWNAAWGHCIVPRQGIPKHGVRHARPQTRTLTGPKRLPFAHFRPVACDSFSGVLSPQGVSIWGIYISR